MGIQQSFTDMEYAERRRKTKREEFLEIMDSVMPWEELSALIAPHYYKGSRGRPPRGIEPMLRMYLLSNWFNLSDEGIEDAIYDSYAFKKFMGIDFLNEQAPDATTLCKFRKILNDSGIGAEISKAIKVFLDENGKLMHGGTIVDASILDAPTSTKNQDKARDPEMHSTKKGNNWYFGAKLHIGVDAGSGYIHSVEMTAANTHDSQVAALLIRPDDEVLYGDSAYQGIEKQEIFKNDPHLSTLEHRTNSRKPYRKNGWIEGPGMFWLRFFEQQKSRTCWKVEYPFLVIKRIFGWRRIRYRGLKKNLTQAHILCASANLYMLALAGGWG